MEIRINLEERTPPSGRVQLEDARGGGIRQASFTGWLGLLQALDEMLGPTGGTNTLDTGQPPN